MREKAISAGNKCRMRLAITADSSCAMSGKVHGIGLVHETAIFVDSAWEGAGTHVRDDKIC